jgi:predicted RNA binding protein YcfA (HicA-like mRNA interferase family)
VDGKTVIKILEQHGFKCLRIKGSHHIMGTGRNKPFPVPVHGKKDLKIGTLKSIERLSGVKLK